MSLQKHGTYHLFTGKAIEAAITVLFACLSSPSETRLKYWWNNDNYFSPFFSLISQFASLPLSISPLSVPSAWVIHLFPTQYSTTWACHHPYCHNTYLSNAGDLINIFPHSLLPAFSFLCPSFFSTKSSFSTEATLFYFLPQPSLLYPSLLPSLIRRM